MLGNRRPLVFVGGVHGVGKTTFSKAICQKLHIEYLSASELIQWSSMNSDPMNKLVQDIPETQRRLIDALIATIVDNKYYLLDGHFCLFDAQKNITKVSLQTFELMNPAVMCVVVGDTKDTAESLKARGSDVDLKVIANMQNTELSHAREVSIHLKIPLVRTDRNFGDKVISEISNSLGI